MTNDEMPAENLHSSWLERAARFTDKVTKRDRIRHALTEVEEWLEDFDPANTPLSLFDGPMALLIPGFRSRSGDPLFDQIKTCLIDHGIEPHEFSYAGPGRPFLPEHTFQQDFAIIGRLVAAHIAAMPNARSLLLVSHSAGGLAAVHSVCDDLSLPVTPHALVGFASILTVDWTSLVQLSNQHSTFLENYRGRPDRLCEFVPFILSLYGTQDATVSEQLSNLGNMHEPPSVESVPIVGAGHNDICANRQALQLLHSFLLRIGFSFSVGTGRNRI